ncbi:MAG TPA: hypothetical protein VNW94_22605 [Streptosporangiaceae bacterium]|jgi:hypothetical protein|nr:hypothetical protein [Streptosporangiaceae bacterium]
MRPHRIGRTRRALAVLALTMAAAGGTVAVTGPAFAGGGVDLQSYGCDLQAPGTWVVLRSYNAYGWRCFNGIYDQFISVNDACRAEYGNGSSSYYLDYWNPYSWRCH